MTAAWRALLGAGLGLSLTTACDTPPEAVAEQYVVAREHGHPRQAYGLLSQPDRDVRAYRDFAKAQVQAVNERIERLLARRTKVHVRSVAAESKQATAVVELVRVDVGDGSRQLIAAELKTDGPSVASRLQKLNLPTRTSTETLTLVRESGEWRVFLGLAAQDEVARQRDVDRLKRLGIQRMQQGHLAWAWETYEAARKLDPRDPGISHAITVLKTLTDEKHQAAQHAEEAAAYRPKVIVNRVKVQGRRVLGEVRNTGDRYVEQVEVTVTGLDRQGAPITEAVTYPVGAPSAPGPSSAPASRAGAARSSSAPASRAGAARSSSAPASRAGAARSSSAPTGSRPVRALLAPGHAHPFVATFENPPQGWKGAVEVRVTRVRFGAPSKP